MFKNRNKTIGKRITQLVAVAVFTSVLAAATLHIFFQVFRDIELRRASLEATAYALASSAGEAAANNNSEGAMAALSAVSRVPDLEVAVIKRQDGSVLATMGQTAYLTKDIVTPADGPLSMLYKGKLPVSVEIVKAGNSQGRLTIIGDISSLRWQLAKSILTILVAALITAVMGVLAARPVQRRIVGPLSKLTSTIEALRTSRNYSVGLEDDNTPDETGILVKAFNGLMADIRFRDQALQQLAYHDPLTGLPNRVSFQRSVDEHLVKTPDALKGAIVLLNIHGFRALNDAFSHSIGDAILMTVAASIKSALPEDVTLARYGGDEFALLFKHLDAESDVEMAMARVQSAFHKPLQIGDLELHVGLTIGANMLSVDSQSDEALRNVDLALAEAKNTATGRVQFFHAQFAETVRQDTALGQALRQATKEGGFELHYQPQLDLINNKISGYEALLRWKHPLRGNISPAIFIPLAERIGLVTVIGDWVLMEGCRQAATWKKLGHPDRIMSVNVSLAQILTAGFVEKIRGALRKSGLPPDLLCIELTESIFAGARYADIIIVLEALAKDGVKLALDDFGTGYSSLGYLSKLPFHSVKIDRSFVSQADKSKRKSGMLKSIVEMIHSLDMTVVAEGAETLEELALLRNLKVNKVQGYVVAKPTSADIAAAQSRAIDAEYLAKVS